MTYCEGNADIVDCNVDILFLLDVLSDCKRLILVCAELIFNSAPPIRVVNPLIETVLLFKLVFNVFVDVLSVFIFEYTSLKLVSYNPSLLLVDAVKLFKLTSSKDTRSTKVVDADANNELTFV